MYILASINADVATIDDWERCCTRLRVLAKHREATM